MPGNPPTPTARARRLDVGRLERGTLIAALALMGLGLVLPWTWSGSVGRGYWATVAAGRSLDVLPGSAATWVVLTVGPVLLLWLWAVAWWSGRRRLAVAAAVIAAIGVLGAGLAVRRTPLEAGVGTGVAMAAATLVVVVGLLLLRRGAPLQAAEGPPT